MITWNKDGSHKHYPKHILNFEIERNDEYLLFLKFENQYTIPNIDLLIKSIELILNDDEKTFIILTPKKKPPLLTANEDEFVFSFGCKLEYFKKLADSIHKTSLLSTELLFEILDLITGNHSEFRKILIRQFPFEIDTEGTTDICDVVIPHRGSNKYLSSVLYFLNQMKETKIHVGIDQEINNRC